MSVAKLVSTAGSAPRVRTITKERNAFWGTYKRHEIYLTRENRNDDWYIQVMNEDGGRLYDGPWSDSAGKPRREAILEALRGAMLWPNSQVTGADPFSSTNPNNAPHLDA